MPEVLWAQPDVPGDLGPCSSACGVEQLSRATRGRVRWPVMSTSVPEDLRSGPMVHGVDQPSRATRARV